jgi:hypothetical protein
MHAHVARVMGFAYFSALLATLPRLSRSSVLQTEAGKLMKGCLLYVFGSMAISLSPKETAHTQILKQPPSIVRNT